MANPAKTPPALGCPPLPGSGPAFWRDPVDLVRRGHQRHGRAFTIHLGRQPATVPLGPDLHRVFFRRERSRPRPRPLRPAALRPAARGGPGQPAHLDRLRRRRYKRRLLTPNPAQGQDGTTSRPTHTTRVAYRRR